jgi:hypothetical protein
MIDLGLTEVQFDSGFKFIVDNYETYKNDDDREKLFANAI